MCLHDPFFLSRTPPKGGLAKFSYFRGRLQSACPRYSLVHGVLCSVDVNNSVHHLAAVSGVRRQVLHVLPLVRMCFWHRRMNRRVWERQTYTRVSAGLCGVLYTCRGARTHLSRRDSREGPRTRWCPAVSGWAPAGIVPWSYRRSAETEPCTSPWWTRPSQHTSLRPPDPWTAPKYTNVTRINL